MRKTIISLILFFIIITASFYVYESQQSGSLTLRFSALANGEPLKLNQSGIRNPGGEGDITLRDFRFFISNVKLSGINVVYKVPDSYHLARFDNEAHDYRIILNNVPRKRFTSIALSVGVDPAANTSIRSVGDLDPNSRMAWNWQVGYKFVLFEGVLTQADVRTPLVYHVGFDENYKELSFSLGSELFAQPNEVVDFKVDAMALFSGMQPIDMSELSSVKFNPEDARHLANRFDEMLGKPVVWGQENFFKRFVAFIVGLSE